MSNQVKLFVPSMLNSGIMLLTLILCFMANHAISDEAKLSRNLICHDQNSSSFARIKQYRSFASMEECLKEGRAYKKWDGKGHQATNADVGHRKYRREDYGPWLDEDNDCQSTRHEILTELSAVPVTLTSDGCRVVRGRWIDPYTNTIFFDAKKLDIDHIVPVAWAHERGGHSWNVTQKKAFYNDLRNLIAVDRTANRAKGADGPLKWLPPYKPYQCQYVVRFMRVVKIWKLTYKHDEREKIQKLKDGLCIGM